MSKGYVVAVVGATGVVGKEMIETLQERKFPVAKLIPLASERSAGSTIDFKGNTIDVDVLNDESFIGVDFALFSAGGSISEKYAPLAVKSGAVVIDNTSHFRMDNDVPLIVPEVNGDAIKGHKGIIANPNCSTAQMVLLLKPIYDAVGIERIVVSTYQSVSGAGKDAIQELESQSRANLSGSDYQGNVFKSPIAFNVIPQIDVFLDNGYTKEEMKMIQETQKILRDDTIRITATAVRVPVFVGHSESINIQTKEYLSADDARKLFEAAPGVSVLDSPLEQEYPTPRQVAGEDNVFVGRIRNDLSIRNGIELWCVGDNLKKGAALNAVQIAEFLVQSRVTA
ncbi:aspartate-semialdehyde dehydrogenase [bacterium]|nr:aspartate-semialdehyde dehydrogenase [bacterium]